jgi:hypothetical protein
MPRTKVEVNFPPTITQHTQLDSIMGNRAANVSGCKSVVGLSEPSNLVIGARIGCTEVVLEPLALS